MHVEHNKSLKKYNTFGIDCNARQFVEVTNTTELKKVLHEYSHEALFILGGGSNMLLTKNIDALVIYLNLKGKKVISETDNYVLVTAMAGENWHDFVLYCIAKNYGGIENLSLIPGNIGSAPIQNIGAYGVELKDTFESCTAVEISSASEKTFTLSECNFGYRNSIFKNDVKGRYIITSVTFKLSKTNHKHVIGYGDIKNKLEEKNIKIPTIKDISDVVITIRQSKLPDPKKLGNSGSFFKNPIIDLATFQKFKENHPEAPYYEISPSEIKIPAGWLIEQAGFKGIRFGDAGVHKNQALVLVNYANATGSEIWDLAMKIQKIVLEKFGVLIEPEVNIF